jgi:hypothetical protein
MNRYSEIKILRNENEFVGTIGTQYYGDVIYPEIPILETDIWVETEFGDRLDLLSNQFYDDVTLYWIIAIANPNKVNMGSLFLPPGTQIRIPVGVTSIVDSYNILNK